MPSMTASEYSLLLCSLGRSPLLRFVWELGPKCDLAAAAWASKQRGEDVALSACWFSMVISCCNAILCPFVGPNDVQDEHRRTVTHMSHSGTAAGLQLIFAAVLNMLEQFIM
jgi:hypothetical protein